MQEMYRLLKNPSFIFGSLYEKHVKKLCYPHGLFWYAANREMDDIVYSFAIRLSRDGMITIFNDELPAIRKAVKWSWENGNVFEYRKCRISVDTEK